MTNIKRWEEDLLKQVEVLFAKRGFVYVKSQRSFRMKKLYGWVSYHLVLIPHPPTDFDITANLALRIDAVQDLIFEDKERISKKGTASTATIGCELGNLVQGKPRRWTVASDEDVTPVALSLDSALESIALPFFEKYSNLELALSALSNNEREGRRLAPFDDIRCIKAVALAYILGNYPELELLIQQNEAYLVSRKDEFGLKQYLSFVKKIRSLVKSQDSENGSD